MISNTECSIKVNIYGFVIECKHSDKNLLNDVLRHFKDFLVDSNDISAHAIITVNSNAPDYNSLPALPMVFTTPRNVVFQDSHTKIIDYSGRGIILKKDTNASYEIISSDKALIRELCHLTILSLWGQHCDDMGWLRVHATAVTVAEQAITIMMPAGGGKSSLLKSALHDPDFKMLGEDIALIDNKGKLHPFHSPIGINSKEEVENYPSDFVWKEDRTEFGDKYRVDAAYFKDRLETNSFGKIFFLIGIRLINGDPAIKKICFSLKLRSVLREIVFGVGVYQGFEYVVNHSPWQVLKQIPALVKRFLLACSLMRKNSFYTFYISRDQKKNIELLKEWALSKNPHYE